MTDLNRPNVFSLATAILLGVGMTLADHNAADAQIVFDMRYSDAAVERVQERGEPLDARSILGWLAEEGRVTFRGERPVEARMLAFFLGEGGEQHERVASEPFRLPPGEHPVGRLVREGEFWESVGQLFAAKDLVFFPDSAFDEIGFPDSAFDEIHFPDSAFEEMGLEREQVGLVLVVAPAAAPVNPDVRVLGTGLTFQPDPEDIR